MLRTVPVLAGAFLAAIVATGSARAASMETIHGALASAYNNNATLNAARAEQRATDEGVPQALAGFRPTISATASAQLGRGRTQLGTATAIQSSIGIQLEQPIFRGNRTRNGLKIAETAVLAGRESLRNTEQDILLDAATAYMDVMRDRAIVGLNSQNVEFLRAQVKAAQDRLDVGEGTRTDVAQANARLSAAESQYAVSVAALAASAAVYQQVVGHAPGNLSAASPVERMLPGSPEAAATLAMGNHPAIMASKLNSDVSAFNVKIAEGALLPTASLTAGLSRSTGPGDGAFSNSASIGARLTIPIYTGGLSSSQVREAKERFGQSQIQVDVIRAQVRALVIANYGQLQAARAQLSAAQAQVSASQLALEGIQEERNVGQRTTLDVLNAQQEVLNGRISLVRAQRDRVVASYALLAAVGKLSAEALNLQVQRYYPDEHYHEVRDLWFGLRTPDGR